MACKKKHLPSHPFCEVKPPKLPKNKQPKAIEKEAIQKMLKKTRNPRDRAILLFFRDTACRADEALQLKWGDLKLNDGTTETLGKGDRARSLFFKATTRRALEKYRQTLKLSGHDDPVWPGEDGPLTYDGLYKIFRRLAIAANVEGDFSPHSWRHAFGRDATLAGMPTAGLQQIMGHENMSTTQIYTTFKIAELQQLHDEYSPVDGDSTNGSDMVK